MTRTVMAGCSGDTPICQRCLPGALDQLLSPQWGPLAWPELSDLYATPPPCHPFPTNPPFLAEL